MNGFFKTYVGRNGARLRGTLLLALVLALLLTACGRGKADGKDPAQNADVTDTTQTAPKSEQEPQTPAEPPLPSQSVQPAEPPLPSQSVQPAEPPLPSQSVQPAEPERPAEPAVPEIVPAPAAETPAEPVRQDGSAAAGGIASMAYDLLGCAFESGGSGPDTFDNSGFVYYICRENGIAIPRRSSEMADFGESVAWDDLQSGDICVMANEIGGSAGFVGIYVGDMQFIACNKPGTVASVQNLDVQYWRDRFISGRRVA
ncbi:MAG: hypothetical protein E7474_03060 [Ruminococcaceae bacterium]|nr:hypothetical protein [Oscillospiraceae bacterium]